MISGITVVSGNICLGKDKFDSPINWASEKDQKFYLNKMIKSAPIGIMSIETYQEVLNNPRKKSIYSKLNLVIINSKINYKKEKFITNKANSKHVFTKITNIKENLEFYKKYFKNNNIFILGDEKIYRSFLPFCDNFWLTIENNLNFAKGISLFPKCKNTNELINIMQKNKLFISKIDHLSKNTTLYEFRKIK